MYVGFLLNSFTSISTIRNTFSAVQAAMSALVNHGTLVNACYTGNDFYAYNKGNTQNDICGTSTEGIVTTLFIFLLISVPKVPLLI